MNRHESGFTLIELLVTTAVLTVLAAIGAAVLVPEYRSGINDKTVGEIYAIQEAAQNYYVDKQVLPGGSNCSSAIAKLLSKDYLLAIDTQSPWGSSYKTACTGTRFEVKVDIPDPYNKRALNTLIDASVAGNTVTSSVATPDMLPATEDFLSRVDTGNPNTRTMEADILMDGNSIRDAGVVETNKLNAGTGNFSDEVQANNILLTGGDLNTNGGDVKLGGGDVSGVDNFTMVNGVRLRSEGGKTLRIDANQTRIDNKLRVDGTTDLNGNVDVAGTIRADEVITREGVRLSESLQETKILKLRQNVTYPNRIRAPDCAPGTTPIVFSTPVSMGGGVSPGQTAPMGSITTRMVHSGNFYKLEMRVTDTNNRFSHNPPDGLDYAMAFTRCQR